MPHSLACHPWTGHTCARPRPLPCSAPCFIINTLWPEMKFLPHSSGRVAFLLHASKHSSVAPRMLLDQFLHFHWAQLNTTSTERPPLTTRIMPFLGHMTLEHYTRSETILFDFLYLI